MFCRNCGKEISSGSALCEECGMTVPDYADATNLLRGKIKLKKKTFGMKLLHLALISITVFFLILPLFGILYAISEYLFGSYGIYLIGIIIAILSVVFIMFFSRKQYKKIGLGNIDITLLSSSNSINGEESTYIVELLFDNRNPIDKRINLGQLMKSAIQFVENNSEPFNVYENEFGLADLPLGKTKVTCEIVVKKNVVIKSLHIQSGNSIVISDISGPTVHNEIVSTYAQSVKYRAKEYNSAKKRNILPFIIIIIIIIIIFMILCILFNRQRLGF